MSHQDVAHCLTNDLNGRGTAGDVAAILTLRPAVARHYLEEMAHAGRIRRITPKSTRTEVVYKTKKTLSPRQQLETSVTATKPGWRAGSRRW